MTEIFPLHLFPEGALASSVVTTVWVGVFVVAFFNLRLGWVLSGLVVPGYLVPLLLLKPAAAAVVVGEGVCTYFFVWLYSEFLSRHFGWSNFFGRDRFFALVLTSVLVRIAADGLALPALGAWLGEAWQLQFDYHNNLHSFGLIIVALIANNFWKTGLRRGLAPLAVSVGATYLIVRWGLMELTNFSVSNIGYMYEDMAASILASPKAYIILLTTAFVASRMNLFYGWDFSGILIPSLLALQWYQPEKILFSFVEAFIVLALAHAALRLPVFRGLTIEGARKLLLFFNVSFLYKMLLAYALLYGWPDLKITDYYGFGYLLPTLMAVKMHDKDIVARMTRATLQTSAVAAVAATLAGFALSFLPDPWRWLVAASSASPARPVATAGNLVDLLREDKIVLYRTRNLERFSPPTLAESESFAVALRELAALRAMPDDATATRIATQLAAANYTLEIKEGRYLLLREREPRNYRGTFVVSPVAASNLIVEVPAPLDERGALEAGAWIFRNHDARGLAVAGAARRASKDGSADVLVNPNSFYHLFHRVFAVRNVVQVRTYTTETARLLGGARRDPAALEVDEPASTVRVKGELPEDLSLARIKALIDTFDIAWQPVPVTNVQREATATGFVELVLNRDDVRKVLARGLASERPLRLEVLDRSIEGYLQEWLLADRNRIAPAGSGLYRVPSPEILLYFDDELLTPLLKAMRRHYGPEGWSAAGIEELRLINLAAGVVGYELIRYRHRSSGVDYVILAEPDDSPLRRYWGSYVFRPPAAAARPFVLQAPRPLFEVNSFEVAVTLFERLHGSALLIGGAHPEANRDYSADLIRLQNRGNVFNLVNQALLREAGDAPLLSVQSRVLGFRQDISLPASDVLVSFAGGQVDTGQLSPLAASLMQTLARSGLVAQFAGGSVEAAGYDAAGVPQSYYLAASRNKEFAVVWTSPLARGEFRQQSEPTPQANQFAALRLSSREADLAADLAARSVAGTTVSAPLRRLIDAYVARQDIVPLYEAIAGNDSLRFERIVDSNSRLGYLVIADRDNRWIAAVNLSAREKERVETLAAGADVASEVRRFVDSGAAWLLAGNAR